MDFSFSKARQMLEKSARDFLKKDCRDLARQAEEMAEGYSPESWGKIADLDWSGIGIPEDYEGMGGNIVDQVVLLKEMGYYLFPGPYIASAVCAAALIADYGTPDQKKALLPPMARGKIIVVPATHRPEPFAGECGPERLQREADGGYILTGIRLFVPYAASADHFLVAAAPPDGDGEVFLLVPADQSGITVTPLATIACDKQGEVKFENVSLPAGSLLGEGRNGLEMQKRLQNLGALAHSAYVLGMLGKVVEMTVEYARTRIQFEQPIGRFQVIQHQCADMAMDLEQVRYLTYQAALKMVEGADCTREVSMAKARASDASRRVCLLGVKIHGGTGIIDEYDMQLYFRRAKAMELAFGDGDFHREMVACELGL